MIFFINCNGKNTGDATQLVRDHIVWTLTRICSVQLLRITIINRFLKIFLPEKNVSVLLHIPGRSDVVVLVYNKHLNKQRDNKYYMLINCRYTS